MHMSIRLYSDFAKVLTILDFQFKKKLHFMLLKMLSKFYDRPAQPQQL